MTTKPIDGVEKMHCQKDRFYLPDHVTYLNCAYMSPQLKVVMETGVKAMGRKNLPYEIAPRDFFDTPELLRRTFSKLINNAEPDRIAIIPSVSYGISIVTNNVDLKPGDQILVAAEQFPSNFYPWHKLSVRKQVQLNIVKAPEGNDRGQGWNESILENINEKTKIVALGNVHWTDGTRFDLRAIRTKTREAGALLVVDGTQSVGALPFDMEDIQPDALICAGYKWLLGPYAITLAYLGPCFDEGDPLEENWINRRNSEHFAGLVSYVHEYRDKALRYAMGEQSNFILTPMLQKAIEQLNEWGVSNIQNYCARMTDDPVRELQSLGISIEDERYRGAHLFGLRTPPNMDMEALADRFKKNEVYISIRGNAIRVAFNVFNDENDMDKLVEIIKKVSK